MATADDLDSDELQHWERIMAPNKVWKPKTWVGPNDAVIHLRVFEDMRKIDKHTGTPCDHGDKNTRLAINTSHSLTVVGLTCWICVCLPNRAKCDPGEWMSLACDNALKHKHLCSWTRDLVDGMFAQYVLNCCLLKGSHVGLYML